MRIGEEQIERLLRMRKIIERKIRILRNRLRFYEELLKTIDTILRTSSITTAEQYMIERRKVEERLSKCLEVSRSDEYVEILLKFPLKKDDWRFRKYVKENLLEKFKSEDMERVREGELEKEYMFDYEVVARDDGTIEKLRLWNCDNVRLEKIIKVLEYLCRRYRQQS
ncbi:MAG: hypothetical protein GXO26_01620 [Crenarchaeota archaeon]|nr:hypothetical protein [Thermoproteota archaeon]